MSSAVLWIAVNELRRVLADRTVVFFGLLLPVVIIVIIGTAFGTISEVELGLVDDDSSAASERIVEQLEAIDGVQLETFGSLDSLRRAVRTRSADAGVHLADGYGASLEQGDATVVLLADITSSATGPALAAVDAAVAQEGGRTAAVGVVAEQVGEAAARAAVDDVATELSPVVVSDASPPDEGPSFGSFSYTAPANMVLFVFINTFAVSTVLATDRRYGLVQRMLVTPQRVRTVLLGIGAAKLLFALVQSGLLIGIGWVLFDVNWGDPLAAIVLTVLFAVVATAVGLLVGAVVSDADQAQAVGIPVAVAMGMLGGCMWPLDVVPDVMRALGHLVPHAWAMDAWQELVFDDGALGDIVLEVGVLAGFAVVFGAVASHRLRVAVSR